MEKYIGRTLEIIYQDSKGKITQRNIFVQGIKDGSIRALDLKLNSPRIFKIANVLAFEPQAIKQFG